MYQETAGTPGQRKACHRSEAQSSDAAGTGTDSLKRSKPWKDGSPGIMRAQKVILDLTALIVFGDEPWMGCLKIIRKIENVDYFKGKASV